MLIDFRIKMELFFEEDQSFIDIFKVLKRVQRQDSLKACLNQLMNGPQVRLARLPEHNVPREPTESVGNRTRNNRRIQPRSRLKNKPSNETEIRIPTEVERCDDDPQGSKISQIPEASQSRSEETSEACNESQDNKQSDGNEQSTSVEGLGPSKVFLRKPTESERCDDDPQGSKILQIPEVSQSHSQETSEARNESQDNKQSDRNEQLASVEGLGPGEVFLRTPTEPSGGDREEKDPKTPEVSQSTSQEILKDSNESHDGKEFDLNIQPTGLKEPVPRKEFIRNFSKSCRGDRQGFKDSKTPEACQSPSEETPEASNESDCSNQSTSVEEPGPSLEFSRILEKQGAIEKSSSLEIQDTCEKFPSLKIQDSSNEPPNGERTKLCAKERQETSVKSLISERQELSQKLEPQKTNLDSKEMCEKPTSLERQESRRKAPSMETKQQRDKFSSHNQELQMIRTPPFIHLRESNSLLEKKRQLPDNVVIHDAIHPISSTEELASNDLCFAEQAMQKLPTKTVPNKMIIPVIINRQLVVNKLINTSPNQNISVRNEINPVKCDEVLPKPQTQNSDILLAGKNKSVVDATLNRNTVAKLTMEKVMPFDRDKSEKAVQGSEQAIAISSDSEDSNMSIDSDTCSDSGIDILKADPSMPNSYISRKKTLPVRICCQIDEEEVKKRADYVWWLRYRSNFWEEKLSCHYHYPDKNRNYENESWPEVIESDGQEEDIFSEYENEFSETSEELLNDSGTSESSGHAIDDLPSTSSVSRPNESFPSIEISTTELTVKVLEKSVIEKTQSESLEQIPGHLKYSPQSTSWPPALPPLQTPFIPLPPPLPSVQPPITPPLPSSPPPSLPALPTHLTSKKLHQKQEDINNTDDSIPKNCNSRCKISFKVNSSKKENFKKNMESFRISSNKIKFNKDQSKLHKNLNNKNSQTKPKFPKSKMFKPPSTVQKKKNSSPVKNKAMIQKITLLSNIKFKETDITNNHDSRNYMFSGNNVDLISRNELSIGDSHLSNVVPTNNTIEQMYEYMSKLEMGKSDWDKLFSKKLKEMETIDESDYTEPNFERKNAIVSNFRKPNPHISCTESKSTEETQCNYNMVQNYIDGLMKNIQESNRFSKYNLKNTLPNDLIKINKSLMEGDNTTCNLQPELSKDQLLESAFDVTHSSFEERKHMNNDEQNKEHEDCKSPYKSAKECFDIKENGRSHAYSNTTIKSMINILLPFGEKFVEPQTTSTSINPLVDYESPASESSENEQVVDDKNLANSDKEINQTSNVSTNSNDQLPNFETDLNSNIKYAVGEDSEVSLPEEYDRGFNCNNMKKEIKGIPSTEINTPNMHLLNETCPSSSIEAIFNGLKTNNENKLTQIPQTLHEYDKIMLAQNQIEQTNLGTNENLLSANQDDFPPPSSDQYKMNELPVTEKTANICQLEISGALQENKTTVRLSSSDLVSVEASNGSIISPKIVIEDVFSFPNVVFALDESIDNDEFMSADIEDGISQSSFNTSDDEIDQGNIRPRLINGFGEPLILNNESQPAVFKVKTEKVEDDIREKEVVTKETYISFKFPESNHDLRVESKSLKQQYVTETPVCTTSRSNKVFPSDKSSEKEFRKGDGKQELCPERLKKQKSSVQIEVTKPSSKKRDGSLLPKNHPIREPNKKKTFLSRQFISDSESSSDNEDSHIHDNNLKQKDNSGKKNGSIAPKKSSVGGRNKSAISVTNSTTHDKPTASEQCKRPDEEAQQTKFKNNEASLSRKSKNKEEKFIGCQTDTEFSRNNDVGCNKKNEKPKTNDDRKSHGPNRITSKMTSATKVQLGSFESHSTLKFDNTIQKNNTNLLYEQDHKVPICSKKEEMVTLTTNLNSKKTPDLKNNRYEIKTNNNSESTSPKLPEQSENRSTVGFQRLSSSPSARLHNLNKFNRQLSIENNKKSSYFLSPIEGLEAKKPSPRVRQVLAAMDGPEDVIHSSNFHVVQTPMAGSEDTKKSPYERSALKRKLDSEMEQVFPVQVKQKPTIPKITLKSNISPPYKTNNVQKTMTEVRSVPSTNVVDSIMQAMSSCAPPTRIRDTTHDKYSSRFLPLPEDHQTATDNPELSHVAPLFPSRPTIEANSRKPVETMKHTNIRCSSREVQPESTKTYKPPSIVAQQDKNIQIRKTELLKDCNRSKTSIDRKFGLALRFYGSVENQADNLNTLSSLPVTSDIEKKIKNCLKNDLIEKEKEIDGLGGSEAVERKTKCTSSLPSMPVLSDNMDVLVPETETCHSVSKKFKVCYAPKSGMNRVANTTPKVKDQSKGKKSKKSKYDNVLVKNCSKPKSKRSKHNLSIKVSLPLSSIQKDIFKSASKKCDSRKTSNKCLKSRPNGSAQNSASHVSQSLYSSSTEKKPKRQKYVIRENILNKKKGEYFHHDDQKINEKPEEKSKTKRKLDLPDSGNHDAKKMCSSTVFYSETNSSALPLTQSENRLTTLPKETLEPNKSIPSSQQVPLNSSSFSVASTEYIEESTVPQVSPKQHLEKLNADSSPQTTSFFNPESKNSSVLSSGLEQSPAFKQIQIQELPTSSKLELSVQDGTDNSIINPSAQPVNLHLSLEQGSLLEPSAKEAIRVKPSSLLIAFANNVNESDNKEPTPNRRLSVLNTEMLSTRTNLTFEEPNKRNTWYMTPEIPEKPTENANLIPTQNCPSQILEVKTEATLLAQYLTDMANSTKRQLFVESFENSMKIGKMEFEKLCDIIDCIKLDFKFKQNIIDGVKKLMSQDVIDMEILRAGAEFKKKFTEREASFKETFKKLFEHFEPIDFKYPCLVLIFKKLKQKVLVVCEDQEDLKIELMHILKKFLVSKETKHIFTQEYSDIEKDCETLEMVFDKNSDESEKNYNVQNTTDKITVQVKTEECNQSQNIASSSSSNCNFYRDSETISNNPHKSSSEMLNSDEISTNQASDKNTCGLMPQNSFMINSLLTRDDTNSTSLQSSDVTSSCSPSHPNKTSTDVILSPNTLNSQTQNTSTVIKEVPGILQTEQISVLSSVCSKANTLNPTLEANNVCTTNQHLSAQSIPLSMNNPAHLNFGFANMYEQVQPNAAARPIQQMIEVSSQVYSNSIDSQSTLQSLLNVQQSQNHLSSNAVLPQVNTIQKKTNNFQVNSQNQNLIKRMSAECNQQNCNIYDNFPGVESTQGHISVARTSPSHIPVMQNFQEHTPAIRSTQGHMLATHTSLGIVPETQNLQVLIQGRRSSQENFDVAKTSPGQIPAMQNSQGPISGRRSSQDQVPVARTSPGHIPAMQNIQGPIPGRRTSKQASVPSISPGQVPAMQNFQGPIPVRRNSKQQASVPSTSPGQIPAMQNFQQPIQARRYSQEQIPVARITPAQFSAMQSFQECVGGAKSTQRQIPVARILPGQIPQNVQGIRSNQQEISVAKRSPEHMTAMQNFQGHIFSSGPSQGQSTRTLPGQIQKMHSNQRDIPVMSSNQQVPFMLSHQKEIPGLSNSQEYNSSAMTAERQISAVAYTANQHQGVQNLQGNFTGLSTSQRLDLMTGQNSLVQPTVQNYDSIHNQQLSNVHYTRNFNQANDQRLPYRNSNQTSSQSTGTDFNYYYNQFADQSNTNYVNNSIVHVPVSNTNSLGGLNHRAQGFDQRPTEQVTSTVENLPPQTNFNQHYLNSQDNFKNPLNIPQQRYLNRSQSQNQQVSFLGNNHQSSTHDTNHSSLQRRHSVHSSSSMQQTYQQQNNINIQNSNLNYASLSNNSSSYANQNCFNRMSFKNSTLSENQVPQISEQAIEDNYLGESVDIDSFDIGDLESLLGIGKSDLPMIPLYNTDNSIATGNQQNPSLESENTKNFDFVKSISSDSSFTPKILAQIDLIKQDKCEIFCEYNILHFKMTGYEIYKIMDHFKKKVEALDVTSGESVVFSDEICPITRKYSADDLKLLFSLLIVQPIIADTNCDTSKEDESSQRTNNTSQETPPVETEDEDQPDLILAIDSLKRLIMKQLKKTGKLLYNLMGTLVGFSKDGSKYALKVVQEIQEEIRKAKQNETPQETIVLDD